MTEQFLDPTTLSRISNYSLLARSVVEGFISGLHRGLYHGFGSEFVEYRNYNRGDDLKYVDWKVYARLHRVLMKVFREETNCNCYIVLDTSASMGYAGRGGVSKLHYGKMIAACLAYLVNRQGDNVGLFGYSEALRCQVKPSHRSGQVHRLCVELARLQPAGACDHHKILNYLAEHFDRRGIIVMISDFLDVDENLMRSLKRFRAAHHDLALFQLLDDDELDFEMDGFSRFIRFVDSESSAEIITAPAAVGRQYHAALTAYLDSFARFCQQHDVDYSRVRTSQPLDGVLAAYLHRRESFR